MNRDKLNYSDKIFNLKFFLGFICFSFFLVALPYFTLAHGSGVSVEKVVGSYLLDVGYSPEVLFEDTQVRFDFAILDNNTKQEQKFSEVWVRVEKDEQLLFAGGLGKARFGATGMAFNFLESGEYVVSARFSNATSTLAESDFNFTVLEVEVGFWDKPWVMPTSFGVASLLLIVGLIFILKKLKPRSLINSSGLKRIKWGWLLNIFLGIIFVAIGYGVAYLAVNYIKLPTLSEIDLFTSSSGNKTIVLTDEGFSPAEVTVPVGSTVTFQNATDRPFWPASNLHPAHEIYPEFDPKQSLNPGESWSFQFNKVGDWGYHDHIRSYYIGRVNVISK